MTIGGGVRVRRYEGRKRRSSVGVGRSGAEGEVGRVGRGGEGEEGGEERNVEGHDVLRHDAALGWAATSGGRRGGVLLRDEGKLVSPG
jgi:hypothetical protein